MLIMNLSIILSALLSGGVCAQENKGTKPDYTAPASAPCTSEEVVVPASAGHRLAGSLTLPIHASKAQPVSAIVTITGSGPQDRDGAIGLTGYQPFRQIASSETPVQLCAHHCCNPLLSHHQRKCRRPD